jgi:hypothetical protein
MNTAAINSIAIDGAAGLTPPPAPSVIGPTVFASTGQRRGLDPGRSTGTAREATATRLYSTGTRHGIDPGRSTGRGA